MGSKELTGSKVKMPADPCLVTVRAGPAHSKDYENFVANKLKDEVLKEISSNLQDDLKEEALSAFKESVKEGWSIKDCICKVQNEVLPQVPKERNKFSIKFTYDNQLQVRPNFTKVYEFDIGTANYCSTPRLKSVSTSSRMVTLSSITTLVLLQKNHQVRI